MNIIFKALTSGLIQDTIAKRIKALVNEFGGIVHLLGWVTNSMEMEWRSTKKDN